MRLCGKAVVAINMADRATDQRKQKVRGRYKEYLHLYNPYKFKAAQRTNRKKFNRQTNDANSTISHGDLNKSDTEFDSYVFIASCDDSSSLLQCDVDSSEAIAIQNKNIVK